MYTSYPRLEIHTEKLKENVQLVSSFCHKLGISVWGVSKCYCAYPEIAQAEIEGGIDKIADSRISNLYKLKDLPIQKVLLRIPMKCEVDDVVEYADYSLNSELETIKLLGSAALRRNKIHNIIIMVDLGDLREGILPDQVEEFTKRAIEIPGISIKGYGVNLTCYGGVIPDENNLGKLVQIAKDMQNKFDLDIEIISGGNSSSFYLLQEGRMPKGVNNLRFGEVMILGREAAFERPIEGLNKDAFILKGQIVEIKQKPSVPTGTIGVDAFENTPVFEDRGIIKRAIIAMGRQDIEHTKMHPIDKKIDILGASSDHTILDVTKCDRNYKLGDVIEFTVDYVCLLRAMSSSYILKVVKK